MLSTAHARVECESFSKNSFKIPLPSVGMTETMLRRQKMAAFSFHDVGREIFCSLARNCSLDWLKGLVRCDVDFDCLAKNIPGTGVQILIRMLLQGHADYSAYVAVCRMLHQSWQWQT